MTISDFQDLTLTTSDGLDVYYRHHPGDGKHPAVIFLHGLTGNRTAWEEFEQFFAAQGYATYSMDLRGHGRSTKTLTTQQFAVPAITGDVQLLCQKHGLEHSIIVGHCFGGLVTLQAAHDFPELFSKVVLISPFYRTDKAKAPLLRSFFNSCGDLLFHIPLTIPRLRRHFRYPQYWKLKKLPYPVFLFHDLLANPLTLYQQGLKQASRVDALSLAAQINKPVLVWSGTRDPFVPHSYSQLMAKTIRGSHFEAMEGGDHIINIRYPEIMTGSILHYIEETA